MTNICGYLEKVWLYIGMCGRQIEDEEVHEQFISKTNDETPPSPPPDNNYSKYLGPFPKVPFGLASSMCINTDFNTKKINIQHVPAEQQYDEPEPYEPEPYEPEPYEPEPYEPEQSQPPQSPQLPPQLPPQQYPQYPQQYGVSIDQYYRLVDN